MSRKLNISVLVAARDEYIEQLKCIIAPLIFQGFNSIYSDSVKITNGKNTLYKFQELLKEIPKWNQTILQEESKRIKRKCPYIMDIVTAIFVSNVKILASIRLKGNNENIKVKIPTSDIFIHSIYIESAQKIFYNPFLFYHKHGNNHILIENNKKQTIEIIRNCVDETIREMLPFDEILQEYLVNALNENTENADSGSDSDSVSDSDSDSDYLKGDDIADSEVDDTEDYKDPEDDVKNVSTSLGKNNFIQDSDSDSDPEPDNFGDYSSSSNIPNNIPNVQQNIPNQINQNSQYSQYSNNNNIPNVPQNVPSTPGPTECSGYSGTPQVLSTDNKCSFFD